MILVHGPARLSVAKGDALRCFSIIHLSRTTTKQKHEDLGDWSVVIEGIFNGNQRCGLFGYQVLRMRECQEIGPHIKNIHWSELSWEDQVS